MVLHSFFKHYAYRYFAPGILLNKTYEAFKNLLEQDGLSHDLMAGFEMLYHDGIRQDFVVIDRWYAEFASAVAAMIDNLEKMSPSEAVTLRQYNKKFDFYIRYLLAPPESLSIPPFVVSLSTLSDPSRTGNKSSNLAILKNELHAPVPDGFSITTSAFFRLIEHNNLRESINDLLAEVDIEDQHSLLRQSRRLVALIRSARIPSEISAEIINACKQMERQQGCPVQLAVRSSAACEDGEQSFAGQYQTVLGVGRENLLESYLEVVASKYSPEALFYRITVGLTDEETPVAVLVLAMVDAAKSGVVYTVDPTAGDRERLVVQSIYGLGEMLVGGSVNADCFVINRRNAAIEDKQHSSQQEKLVVKGKHLVEKELDPEELDAFSITDTVALELADWGRKIEAYYGQPQDIEWALTSDETLFLLQARPLQSHIDLQDEDVVQSDTIDVQPLTSGTKAAGGVASGTVHLADHQEVRDVEQGVILVVRNTPPSLVRILNKLGAVVADKGAIAGHFATVCREFGVPLLVNTDTATAVCSHGLEVTVDADRGIVYAGKSEIVPGADKVGNKGDNLPYLRKLRAILKFITPLKLVDPAANDFLPSSCRSMHDIIRYTHERAIQTMFSLGNTVSGRSGTRLRLQTDIPLEVYLLDLGGGVCKEVVEAAETTVPVEKLCSEPFLALWRGISHPGVDWQAHSHFDWKSFDEITMAGGIATKNSGDFASYAIISREYLNFNMRFGYHFTLVDAMCGPDSRTNYCQLRFAGGGGNYAGRTLRLEFLIAVLHRLGMETQIHADLLDARVVDMADKEISELLDLLGRLLGATKLMDMVLKDRDDVEYCVEKFFAGQYNFSR